MNFPQFGAAARFEVDDQSYGAALEMLFRIKRTSGHCRPGYCRGKRGSETETDKVIGT